MWIAIIILAAPLVLMLLLLVGCSHQQRRDAGLDAGDEPTRAVLAQVHEHAPSKARIKPRADSVTALVELKGGRA